MIRSKLLHGCIVFVWMLLLFCLTSTLLGEDPTALGSEQQALHELVESRKRVSAPDPCGGRTHVLGVLDGGWLGNQMSEYATVLALADCMGFIPMISKIKYLILSDVFSNITIEVNDACLATLPEVRGIAALGVCTRVLQGDPMPFENMRLMDPNSLQLYHFYNHAIRSHFQFKESIQNEVDDYLRLIVSERHMSLDLEPDQEVSEVTFVGVHIRRRMYDVHLKRFGFDLVTEKWFFQAMEKIKTLIDYKEIVFVVASDDPTWTSGKFANHPDIYLTTDYYQNIRIDPVYFDFAILSSCNHTIFDYGTYGYWSAYLANGMTIITDGYGSNVDGPLARHSWLINADKKWVGLNINNGQ